MATEQVLPPEEIETAAELAAALQHLAGRTIRPLSNRLLDLIAWDREQADREKRPSTKPARQPAASTGVIATWLNGTNPPNQDELHFLLRSRGNNPGGHTVDETLLDRWTEASTRVRRNETTGPPGDTRRVSTITDDYALDKLGIARAIQLPGTDPNTLPTHITRDRDPDLADRVIKAAEIHPDKTTTTNGGFIVLRGPSGAGKSHAALHTITTLLGDKDNALGDWWFVKPSCADDIHALANHPVPRTVLWLDELVHHLDTDQAQQRQLTADISVLLRQHHPILIIGGIWPENYDRLTQPPPEPGQPDPHQHTRALLNLAGEPIDLHPHFSDTENASATQAGTTDPRIRTVLTEAERTGSTTPTQDLAGHHYIRQRWQQALHAHRNNHTSPAAYGYAIIAAATDAHRLGHHTPIPRKLLQQAAPGYLTPDQMNAAPKNWLTKAINYATHQYRGHQPLQPHPSTKPRQTLGYTPTDPLQLPSV